MKTRLITSVGFLAVLMYVSMGNDGKYYHGEIWCPVSGKTICSDENTIIPPDPEKPNEPEIPDEPEKEDPNENNYAPVIQELEDLEVYQGKKFLIQFYAYDIDGYIKEFYFSSTGGSYWSKFTPEYIGNSAYADLLLFGDLGEYDCKIKVVDIDSCKKCYASNLKFL